MHVLHICKDGVVLQITQTEGDLVAAFSLNFSLPT
jgi:hypothetical protein